MKDTPDVDENFLKAMADMGVDGQGADFNQGIFPMMQGMMMNLLSKDVLYPALDELRAKVCMFYIDFVTTTLFNYKPFYELRNIMSTCESKLLNMLRGATKNLLLNPCIL